MAVGLISKVVTPSLCYIPSESKATGQAFRGTHTMCNRPPIKLDRCCVYRHRDPESHRLSFLTSRHTKCPGVLGSWGPWLIFNRMNRESAHVLVTVSTPCQQWEKSWGPWSKSWGPWYSCGVLWSTTIKVQSFIRNKAKTRKREQREATEGRPKRMSSSLFSLIAV